MNKRKISLYLLISFGVSWLVALIMYLLEIPYGGIGSTIVIAVFYMPAPALATLIVQKGIYHESLKPYGLSISDVSSRRLLLIPLIYLGFIALNLLLVTVVGLLLPGFGELIFSQEYIQSEIMRLAPADLDPDSINLPDSPYLLLLIILIAGIIGGFSINLPFMLGEELGWRGLLAEETRSLGFWKSNLLIGLVWGIWHAPVILMGHNYPDYPVTGIFVMCAFTIAMSFILSYLRYKVQTVFAPAVFHGMLNSSTGIMIFFVANEHVLLGNLAGAAGIIATLMITLLIWLKDPKFFKNYQEPKMQFSGKA